MRKLVFLLVLCGLILLAPRSRAQFYSLIGSMADVNLNKKRFYDREPQKIIEINVVDLPESDADKNRIQKGYDNLVAAVQTKNPDEVNKVLDKLDILTKQKVLYKFIQNAKAQQAESLLDSEKAETNEKPQQQEEAKTEELPAE